MDNQHMLIDLGEPLEPWESRESRDASRYGWKADGGSHALYGLRDSPSGSPLSFEEGQLQELANLAARRLAEAIAVRQTSLREIAYLEREVENLRSALKDANRASVTPPDWLLSAEYEVMTLDSEENGSGCEAVAIEPTTSEYALRFLRTLGDWIPRPEIGFDNDGHIYLEWQKSARWVFTVSISPTGEVYYAGLFGTNRSHGVEELAHGLPQTIRANLSRFLTQ